MFEPRKSQEDLHPVDLQTRVKQALDKVRPMLKAHGGDVELLSLEDGMLRLRLQGGQCPRWNLVRGSRWAMPTLRSQA